MPLCPLWTMETATQHQLTRAKGLHTTCQGDGPSGSGPGASPLVWWLEVEVQKARTGASVVTAVPQRLGRLKNEAGVELKT